MDGLYFLAQLRVSSQFKRPFSHFSREVDLNFLLTATGFFSKLAV
jgi:hypothetical protein